jgi:hypothetical protein
MTKKLKVDFYQIELPTTSNVSFEALLQKAIQIQEQARIKIIRGFPIRLQSLDCNDFNGEQVFEGEIIRIRMEDAPVIANLKGGLEDIHLTDDQGIGEQTAFLYHPNTRVLLIHTTQTGVSISLLLGYFKEIGGFNELIYGNAVIQLDTMQKLDTMQSFRRFEVRVAGLENAEIFKDQGRSIEEMVKLSEEFRAPVLDISMSIGYKKNESLDPNIVKRTVNSLRSMLGSRHKQISKIKVSGVTEDGELVLLDFIKHRMIEVVDISTQKNQRKIPYSTRQRAIREAWNHRQDELLKMYCPPKPSQNS